MSDKNNTSAEDYLDSLLRSVTGAGDENESDSSVDNVEELLSNHLGFEEDDVTGTAEDDFLSEFEKEFFDEKENVLLGNVIEQASEAITKEVGEPIGVEEQAFSEEKEASFADEFDSAISGGKETEELFEDAVNDFAASEPQVESATAESVPETEEIMPGTAENVDEAVGEEPATDSLFEVDGDILGAIDEAVSQSGLDGEPANPFLGEQALVDEAISNGDSSVEEDLKGLYDILGMDSGVSELPEGIEDSPKKKKKKGLFSKLFKKSKDEEEEASTTDTENNKTKKSKKAKIDDNIDDILSGLTASDSSEEAKGVDDLLADFSDIDFSGGSSNDAGEESDGISLEDSIFDGMGESSDGGDEDTIDFAALSGGSSGNDSDDGESADGDDDGDDEEEDDKKKKKKKKEKKKKGKKGKGDDEDDDEDDDGKGGGKKKKEKKKKVKKEKKPKEPDVVIKISKIFIVFAITIIAVIIVAAKIGGEYYNYNTKFLEAVSLYVYGNELEDGEELDLNKYETKFKKAYALVRGLDMKEEDHVTFYNQLETIMLMDVHYEAYKSHMMWEDFDHGLDSLIKAVKMYDKHQNTARELDCFDEMTLVLGWVDDKLMETYGLSESEARELAMLKDDDEYAVKVRTIAARVRAEYEKNKVEEELSDDSNN